MNLRLVALCALAFAGTGCTSSSFTGSTGVGHSADGVPGGVTPDTDGQTPGTTPTNGVTIPVGQSQSVLTPSQGGSGGTATGANSTGTDGAAQGVPAGKTCTSADPTIATVVASTCVVTGIKPGTTTIKVTNPNGTTSDIPVTITANGTSDSSKPINDLGFGSGVVGATQLSLTCAQTAPGAPATAVGSATGSKQVQIRGQICPAAITNLTVVFVVDWSGSMTDSDPTNNNTCGRLTATQAILNSIRSQMTAGSSVKVGFVPFSGDVITASVIQPIDINTFMTSVTGDTFCKAMLFTNYVAAFQATQQMLSTATGRSVVYFISDGAPDAGVPFGTDMNTGSEAAGQALQAAIPNLTINSLLLGSDGSEAQGVMQAIAGSPARVKLVPAAADLATAILAFPSPVLDPSTATLNLVSASGATIQSVGISNFVADPTQPATWDFLTQAMTPPAGMTSLNFTLNVKTTDGSAQSAAFSVAVSP